MAVGIRISCCNATYSTVSQSKLFSVYPNGSLSQLCPSIKTLSKYVLMVQEFPGSIPHHLSPFRLVHADIVISSVSSLQYLFLFFSFISEILCAGTSLALGLPSTTSRSKCPSYIFWLLYIPQKYINTPSEMSSKGALSPTAALQNSSTLLSSRLIYSCEIP